MSYSIYIGNATVESEWGDHEDEPPYAAWGVELETHADAPFKPDLTENTNYCAPGYGQWHEAMRQVGLERLWYEELLAQHPGCVKLLPRHLEEVKKAHKKYKIRHPDSVMGLCRCVECAWPGESEVVVHDPLKNFNLYRLEWMHFWMKWALENCEHPAIANH